MPEVRSSVLAPSKAKSPIRSDDALAPSSVLVVLVSSP